MRGDRIVEILESGYRAAINKAYLPWNMLKKDSRELTPIELLKLLSIEVVELEEAVKELPINYTKAAKERHPSIRKILDEVGDIINFASMISDWLERDL